MSGQLVVVWLDAQVPGEDLNVNLVGFGVGTDLESDGVAGSVEGLSFGGYLPETALMVG